MTYRQTLAGTMRYVNNWRRAPFLSAQNHAPSLHEERSLTELRVSDLRSSSSWWKPIGQLHSVNLICRKCLRKVETAVLYCNVWVITEGRNTEHRDYCTRSLLYTDRVYTVHVYSLRVPLYCICSLLPCICTVYSCTP